MVVGGRPEGGEDLCEVGAGLKPGRYGIIQPRAVREPPDIKGGIDEYGCVV